MAKPRKTVVNVSIRAATKSALVHAAHVYEDSMSGIAAKLLDTIMSDGALRKQFFPLLDKGEAANTVATAESAPKHQPISSHPAIIDESNPDKILLKDSWQYNTSKQKAWNSVTTLVVQPTTLEELINHIEGYSP